MILGLACPTGLYRHHYVTVTNCSVTAAHKARTNVRPLRARSPSLSLHEPTHGSDHATNGWPGSCSRHNRQTGVHRPSPRRLPHLEHCRARRNYLPQQGRATPAAAPPVGTHWLPDSTSCQHHNQAAPLAGTNWPQDSTSCQGRNPGAAAPPADTHWLPDSTSYRHRNPGVGRRPRRAIPLPRTPWVLMPPPRRTRRDERTHSSSPPIASVQTLAGREFKPTTHSGGPAITTPNFVRAGRVARPVSGHPTRPIRHRDDCVRR